MKTLVLDKQTIRAALPLLAQSLPRRSPLLEGRPSRELESYADAELSDDSKHLICFMDGTDDVKGLAQWTRLDFDSKLFGMEIGRVNHVITRLDDWETKRDLIIDAIGQAQGQGLVHLDLRVPCNDFSMYRAAQAAGFRLITGKIYFQQRLEAMKTYQASGVMEVRLAQTEDLPALKTIMREAFSGGTRLHLDPDLCSEIATQMHEIWIENSFNGTMADAVLVAQSGEDILGTVSLRIDPQLEKHSSIRAVDIALIAVASDRRGQGIGQALMVSAVKWCQDHDADVMTVNTEVSNVGAVNFYVNNSGFRVSHSTYELAFSKSHEVQ